MEAITEFVGTVNGIVWGIPMLILILGAGLFLTIGLRFLSIMKIPFGFSLLWKGRIPGDDAGDITPFNALMTSLSATIRTGNIDGHLPRRPGCRLLNVDDGSCRHGDQLCRSRLCRAVPRD